MSNDKDALIYLADVRIDELEAENDKLRELVRTLYMCSNFLCGRCEYERGNTCAFDAEAKLHEVGVEVTP